MFKDKNGRELTLMEALPKIRNRILTIFQEFQLMILRWIGYCPSHQFRLFCYRLAGIKIGQGSTIHMWANFFQPRNIQIGEDTIVGDHCFLDGRAKLKIGDHIDIASQVLIYNSEHDVNDFGFHSSTAEMVATGVGVGVALGLVATTFTGFFATSGRGVGVGVGVKTGAFSLLGILLDKAERLILKVRA